MKRKIQVPKAKLNDGNTIPLIGLGTFPMKGFKLIKSVITAENTGYTMFDTSRAYHNESELGIALKLGKLKREDVFVITKISNRQQEIGNVEAALESSLKKLCLSYVDLYLMHWPYPEHYLNTWKIMEKMKKKGLAKSIGVCNCHESHLRSLLNIATTKPVVNEVELHPLLTQRPLIEFCKSNDIKMIAYSPLARMAPELVNNNIIQKLARKYKRSNSQIVLRWDFQHGYITIPKASQKEHLISNISILDFELSDYEMSEIDGLNIDKRFRHNPDTCDFTKL